MKDYFFLALGNLKHRGARSWLTLLGILIGVMAVVSLVSLGSGLKLAVASQFGISTTEVIMVQAGGLNNVGPPGSGVTNPLSEDDVERIDKLPSVELAFSRILPSAKLEFNDKVDFKISVSIPSGKYRKFAYDAVNIEAEYGRLLKDGDTNSVFLGSNFYSNEEHFGKSLKVGDKILIQDKKFKVIGIAKKKGSFLWDNFVMVNEETLRDLMDYGDKVDAIVVKVKNKDLMERARIEIENELRDSRNVKLGEEDFEVSTPDAVLGTVNEILNGVQIFVLIIAFISIFVGAIGIVNTMTTSVLERKKEIGVMKAIGAKNSQIFFQFFIESGLLGLVGGIGGVLFGLILGYLGILGINNFIGSEISLKIDYLLIFLSLIGSFLIGSISGIIPAFRASKQNPVEALS